MPDEAPARIEKLSQLGDAELGRPLAETAPMLAEAIGEQQISLQQALDLPEELLGEIQDAFLDGEGELPSVAEISPLFAGRIEEGVLHCVRTALQAEFEA